jgi:hypothetical protein
LIENKRFFQIVAGRAMGRPLRSRRAVITKMHYVAAAVKEPRERLHAPRDSR